MNDFCKPRWHIEQAMAVADSPFVIVVVRTPRCVEPEVFGSTLIPIGETHDRAVLAAAIRLCRLSSRAYRQRCSVTAAGSEREMK